MLAVQGPEFDSSELKKNSKVSFKIFLIATGQSTVHTFNPSTWQVDFYEFEARMKGSEKSHGYFISVQGTVRNRGEARTAGALGICSPEAAGEEQQCSAAFLLCIQPRPPAHGTVLPGSSQPINLQQTVPCR